MNNLIYDVIYNVYEDWGIFLSFEEYVIDSYIIEFWCVFIVCGIWRYLFGGLEN